MVYTCRYDSPLGQIMLLSNGTELTGLWFEKSNQEQSLDRIEKHREKLPEEYEDYHEEALLIFGQTCNWLDVYFSGKAPDFTPPLYIEGTEFREAVWEILLEIPFGKTMTYGEIASRIARQRGISKMSAQAVGGAVGSNPISLIIPCHRVIGTNGRLVGYGGGLERKAELLKLEKARKL
ncbi:MAG TPA: methylated-DNA--[protein]-cysteine S-methyltransferase [Mogibacterium sp.]|nr:methylated-DNA--[protein]-cysteine S-methyltransferase [Mogibacterium sp.]